MNKALLIRCLLAIQVFKNLCKNLKFFVAAELAKELIKDLKEEITKIDTDE